MYNTNFKLENKYYKIKGLAHKARKKTFLPFIISSDYTLNWLKSSSELALSCFLCPSTIFWAIFALAASSKARVHLPSFSFGLFPCMTLLFNMVQTASKALNGGLTRRWSQDGCVGRGALPVGGGSPQTYIGTPRTGNVPPSSLIPLGI